MIANQSIVPEVAQRFVPVALLFAILCGLRRREAIGGWLMFFYYQIYAGAVASLIILWKTINAYSLRAWQDETRHLFFVIAAVPRLLGFLALAFIASVLLKRRDNISLNRLRFVFAIELVFMAIALAIDIAYFPSALLFNGAQFVLCALWFAYFNVSVRVQRVFVTHDWPEPGSLKTI